MTTQNNYIPRLQKIAFVLKKDELDHIELVAAIDDFQSLVKEISEIDLEDDTNRADIPLSSGKALGTTWAAMCIKDLIRTKTFIKGLFEAIDSLKNSNKQPIHILYAGTGPYATLALPIMAELSEKDVQFTFLEINQASFNNCLKVIKALQFEGYVKASFNTDATKFKIDPKDQIDILLSETMQRALEKEQQVPLVMNLARQVNNDFILIPQEISLKLCLLNWTKFQNRADLENEDYSIRLGHFLKFNLETIKKDFAELEFKGSKTTFPIQKFQLPVNEEYNLLTVLTEIRIFGNTLIKVNESGLTVPLIIEDMKNLTSKTSIEITYKVDKVPGIEFSFF